MKRLALPLLLCALPASAAQVGTLEAARASFVAAASAGPVVPAAPQELSASLSLWTSQLQALSALKVNTVEAAHERRAMVQVVSAQLAELRRAQDAANGRATLKGRLLLANEAARIFAELGSREPSLSAQAALARSAWLDHAEALRTQLYPTGASVKARIEEQTRLLGVSRGPEADQPALRLKAEERSGTRLVPPSPKPPKKAPSRIARLWRKPAVKVGASLTAAGAFNLIVLSHSGTQAASEFLSTYLIEWTMSLDNLVVIAGVLAGLPAAVRPKVLKWGLLGTALARLAMIAGGLKAVGAHPVLFVVFGGFLLTVAAKMLKPEWDLVGLLVDKVKARVKLPRLGKAGGPLLAGTLAVVLYDALFALDSVPAALAVSRSVFIVFAANVFAVLGLRSLFSVIEALEKRFRHLNKGVAAVLVFVAAKMFGLPAGAFASMAVIVGLLGASMLASLRAPRKP